MTLSTGRMTRCLLADTYKKVQEKGFKNGNDIGERMFLTRLTEVTSLCSIFTDAEHQTRATFDQIKREGRLLDEQYFFSIYTSADSNQGFDKIDIGLFNSVQTCRQIEQQAFRREIPVKQCRKFESMISAFMP